MPHFTNDGIIWHYDIDGENGEVLLFIHGWGVDKRVWRQQIKYLSGSFRVMTVDLPGHGKTSWQKVSLSHMAHGIKNILAKENIKKVSVIGSSVGGMLALKLYEAHPALIKRLVFVGSMPKFARTQEYPYGLDVLAMRKLGIQLETNYPSTVNVFFRSLFTKEERESRRFKWLQKFRQTDEVPLREALISYLDILEVEDLRETLKRANIPIQFINGTGDTICNRQTVSFLRRLLPRARFDDFEQCGHFPFLSKPHEFNQVLEDFLKDGAYP